MNDSQHLVIMYLIVLFARRQGLRAEGNQVPLCIFHGHLGEDGSSREVGTVSLDAEVSSKVRGDQDWGGGDALLQLIKGRLFRAFPVPSGIVPGQVEEWAGVF